VFAFELSCYYYAFMLGIVLRIARPESEAAA
jgi:hypothetical protein